MEAKPEQQEIEEEIPTWQTSPLWRRLLFRLVCGTLLAGIFYFSATWRGMRGLAIPGAVLGFVAGFVWCENAFSSSWIAHL